jgi:hypothetical protein
MGDAVEHRGRPTHSSWAATRFSDAGNNDLTTTLRTSKIAAEVGQEVR